MSSCVQSRISEAFCQDWPGDLHVADNQRTFATWAIGIPLLHAVRTPRQWTVRQTARKIAITLTAAPPSDDPGQLCLILAMPARNRKYCIVAALPPPFYKVRKSPFSWQQLSDQRERASARRAAARRWLAALPPRCSSCRCVVVVPALTCPSRTVSPSVFRSSETYLFALPRRHKVTKGTKFPRKLPLSGDRPLRLQVLESYCCRQDLSDQRVRGFCPPRNGFGDPTLQANADVRNRALSILPSPRE